jgi:hypothetical protein
MVAIAALLLPFLLPLLAYRGYQWLARQGAKVKSKPFIELAYGYLPLVLAANLAHYLQLGLGEAGRILPVGLATFGLSGEGMPIWVAHPAVIAFLQGITLLGGGAIAIVFTQKIARQSPFSLFPQHLAIAIFGMSFWQIIL